MDRHSVRAYMDAWDMLPAEGAAVLVACSGGADSVALLHLLRDMPGVAPVCAHYNHMLRGAESERDADFVARLCGGWGIPLVIGRGDVAACAAKRGKGVEEAAREMRYAFLRRAALERGCIRIATAHNADDNAETVLFRLLRGAGARGLSGIPPVRGGLIRPLLNVSRAEIEDYLARHGLPHVEDSSNTDLRYARNGLRCTVLPALEQIHPGAARHICAAAELLREDEDYLSGLAGAFLSAHYRAPRLPLAPFRELPKPVAMRVLRELAGSPGRAHLDRLHALCLSPEGRGALEMPGVRAVRRGGTLFFEPPELPAPVGICAVSPGERRVLPGDGRVLRCYETVFTKEIHNSFNTFYFKNENIYGTLHVASRAPGDAIRLEGRGCTKSVRRLFAEAGLSSAERLRRLVVSDGLGPVAVEGFGVAERCAPVPGMPALALEIGLPRP